MSEKFTGKLAGHDITVPLLSNIPPGVWIRVAGTRGLDRVLLTLKMLLSEADLDAVTEVKDWGEITTFVNDWQAASGISLGE